MTDFKVIILLMFRCIFVAGIFLLISCGRESEEQKVAQKPAQDKSDATKSAQSTRKPVTEQTEIAKPAQSTNPLYTYIVTPLNEAKKTACFNNLKQLGMLLVTSRTMYVGNLPAKTGKELLKELARENKNLLLCPLRAGEAKEGCSYKGTKNDPNTLNSQDILACDEFDNHSDGSIHVLLMNGSVKFITKDDVLYYKAVEQTK